MYVVDAGSVENIVNIQTLHNLLSYVNMFMDQWGMEFYFYVINKQTI